MRACGGVVIGVAALYNCGGVTAERLGVPVLTALVSVPMDAWDSGVCPLCKRSTPINTNVGHGRYYLARKAVAQDL